MCTQDSQKVVWWANTLTKWKLVILCWWKGQKVDFSMKDMVISPSQRKQLLAKRKSVVWLAVQELRHVIKSFRLPWKTTMALHCRSYLEIEPQTIFCWKMNCRLFQKITQTDSKHIWLLISNQLNPKIGNKVLASLQKRCCNKTCLRQVQILSFYIVDLHLLRKWWSNIWLIWDMMTPCNSNFEIKIRFHI